MERTDQMVKPKQFSRDLHPFCWQVLVMVGRDGMGFEDIARVLKRKPYTTRDYLYEIDRDIQKSGFFPGLTPRGRAIVLWALYPDYVVELMTRRGLLLPPPPKG